MFRLRDLKNGLYQIHKKNGPAYEGTPDSIFTVAVKLGLPKEKLITAASVLQKEGYDYADFTLNGNVLGYKRNR